MGNLLKYILCQAKVRVSTIVSAACKKLFYLSGKLFCLMSVAIAMGHGVGALSYRARRIAFTVVYFIILFLLVAISMMTMVKPAYALSNSTIKQPQSWCIDSLGVFYGCAFTSAENACAGANSHPSTPTATSGYCVNNATGQNTELRYYFSRYLPCPPNSTGSGGTCTCIANYVSDPAGANCVPDVACPVGYSQNPYGPGCIYYEEQFIISEPQNQAQLPDVEPGSPSWSMVRVVSTKTGLPKQGAVVRVHLDVDASSGGHDHGETYRRRPRGSISGCTQELNGTDTATDSYQCTTGPDGYAGFTFNAPTVSGGYTISATCISSRCSGSKTMKINVKVDGLVTIPASQFYTLIGDNDKHKDNHYLTPEAASVLWRMAASYHMEAKYQQLRILRLWRWSWFVYLPPLPLHVNDASLVWGGRFDVKGNWATPHSGHRRGVVIDVRANSNTGAIPLASFANFKKMAASYYGADAQVHCTSNKTDGQNRQPPTCIGRDGSQDNNRHMHILLLGVDQ